MTVIGFIVYDITASNFLVGLVSFMQMAPALFMAPVVGVIVDSFERRRILAVSFGVQATGFLLLAILAWLGVLTVPVIAPIVVAMGIAMSFTFPARSALIPNLVGKNALQSAIAASSMLMNSSRIAVPAAGGYIISALGIGAALIFGAGLYYPAALLILTVPLLHTNVQATARRGPLQPSRAFRSFIQDLRDALGYIKANAMLRASLANDVVPFLFGMSYIALMPAIALDVLDGDARTLGLLHGVSGAGALAGTIVGALLVERVPRGHVVWVSTIGWGGALIAVAVGQSYVVILPALFVAGVFQMLYIVQNDTLVQFFASDRFRGRVIAAQMMINSLTTIGFLEIGAVAEAVSTTAALALHGIALIVMGLVTLLFRPAMRDLR